MKEVDFNLVNLYNSRILLECQCDEIGRHDGFKIRC